MSKAKHYSEIDVSKWNTAHFQSYIADKHVEHCGIQYVSAGSIVAERNLIAKYIGTARKDGMYGKDVFKAFIDACFVQYTPTAQYPGLSLWFMTTYMSRLLQQAELDGKRAQAEAQSDSFEEVDGCYDV